MDYTALLDLLGFSTGEIERMGLVAARLSGLFLTAPFFARTGNAPMRVRVALIMALTYMLVPLVPPWAGEGEGQAARMLFAAVTEVMIGAAIGMVVHWGMAATQVAGTVIGFEMGLSMAQVMDPTSGMQENVVSNLLYLAASMIFIIMDGPFLLLEGLTHSFRTLPLGGGGLSALALLEAATAAVLRMFQLALILAAPIVVASKLLYLGMGLINRATPQIQVFFLAMPVIQMVGLVIIGLSMVLFGQVMIRELELSLGLMRQMVGL